MDAYASHPCFVCRQPSVGYSTNLVEIRWYCNRHWFAMSARLDKWLKQREDAQWGDKEWYIKGTKPKARKKRVQKQLPL